MTQRPVPTGTPATTATPSPDTTPVSPDTAPDDELLERIAPMARTLLAATPRLARLGAWSTKVPTDTLVRRLPSHDGPGLGGFDAGVACGLDLVPRDAQQLAAMAHAAWSPAAVARARAGTSPLRDASSQAAWWLAASSVCVEGPVDAPTFLAQLDEFAALASSARKRLAAARAQLASMRSSFEVRDKVAWSTDGGGAIGAYLAGHALTVTRSDAYDLFFVGTFWPSAGLERFDWHGDDGRSGPVNGSRNYVKARDTDELDAVLAVALGYLSTMPALDTLVARPAAPAPGT